MGKRRMEVLELDIEYLELRYERGRSRGWGGGDDSEEEDGG